MVKIMNSSQFCFSNFLKIRHARVAVNIVYFARTREKMEIGY